MAGSTALVLLIALQAAQITSAGNGTVRGDARRGDARLTDICFVDPRHGWAVGDRGAIWHSEDGGHAWYLQDSGTSAPLGSVFFLNDQVGYAVGGIAQPYAHVGSGIVLWTRDGGRHWSHDPHLLLPCLRQVRFFSERQGWALGCRSAMYPTGIFFTRDGGGSWMPLGGAISGGWLAGDFLDRDRGLAVGRSSALAIVQHGALELLAPVGDGLRALAGTRLVPPSYGWLIGDGGLVLMTADLGGAWHPPPGELPSAAQFDFRALAVRGPRCWIAGSPGSRIFFTADAGHMWTVFPTGNTLPLESLTFVDDQHGWAAGALGTILATDNGGQTWRRQRGGGLRAALLAIVSQPEDVPLELFARLSGNEGYLGVAEILNRRDVETPARQEVSAAECVGQAVTQVGGSAAGIDWRFPLRQPGLRLAPPQVIEGWDRSNNGRGMEELEACLVRQIRQWRPDVIVTQSPRPEDDAANVLINQLICQAVRKAADPQSFNTQISQAGLEPWQAKNIYAALPAGARGSIELSTAQLAPRLGRTLADVAAPARALLQDHVLAIPATLGFRLVWELSGPAGASSSQADDSRPSGRGDFFKGLGLLPGSDARRPLDDLAAESIETLERTAQHRRHAQAILDRAEQDPQSALRLLAQTADLTQGLDPAGAAQVMYRLADRYYRTGHWDLAGEMFQALVERYPDDPLCRPALLWLVQYYASSEAALRTGTLRRLAGSRQSVSIEEAPGQDRARWSRAVVLGESIERTRPELFAEPALRFPLAAAYRHQAAPRQAERLYRIGRQGEGSDAWSACARGEAWLAAPKGRSPKPLLVCTRASARPHLDGRLDEPLWKGAGRATLQSALGDDAQWPAVVLLAHDEQFLYVGIRCRMAPGAKYENASGTRTRDADLSAHDRVDILLDLDRGYATYYRLTIDHRGWTADSCWGDSTWDPSWFVAVQADDGNWTAEAAIPLDQLARRSAEKPATAAQEVWALGIQRTVPGVGFQSWTTPAATEIVPEGFGYLKFE